MTPLGYILGIRKYMNEAPPESKDFLILRRSGCRRGASVVLGTAAIKLRDTLAAWLIGVGVTPNMLTVAGFVLSCCAAAFLVVGAGHAAVWEARGAPTPTSWWPLVAALFLTVAGFQDVLDGAVARVGRLDSRFGAVLDSTLDRFSDLLIFGGCAVHFAFVGKLTYVGLSILALANAFLISYVKARADNVVDDCTVGYWQRGERCAAFLVAAYFGHIPAALWLMGTLPIFTVLRRLRYVYVLSMGGAAGSSYAGPGSLAAETTAKLVRPRRNRATQSGGWTRHLTPWRHPRGSAGYDLCAAVTLAFLIAAPWCWPFLYGGTDPLRTLLDSLSGA